MAEYKEKFIVINTKHLSRLTYIEIDTLKKILFALHNINKYYVCNQDEPYSQQVIDIILKGEDAKMEEQQTAIVCSQEVMNQEPVDQNKTPSCASCEESFGPCSFARRDDSCISFWKRMNRVS